MQLKLLEDHQIELRKMQLNLKSFFCLCSAILASYAGQAAAATKCFSCISATSEAYGWRWEALGLTKLPPLKKDDCNHPMGFVTAPQPLVPIVDCNSECYEILVVDVRTVWQDGYWARGCRDDIVNASRPATDYVCEKGWLDKELVGRFANSRQQIQHRICTSETGKNPCNGYTHEVKDQDCSTAKKTKCFECTAGRTCDSKWDCEGAHCYNFTKQSLDGLRMDEYRGCTPVSIFQSEKQCYAYADQASETKNLDVCLCDSEECNPKSSATNYKVASLAHLLVLSLVARHSLQF